MQAYDDTNTRTMYLTLAERMVQKFLKESKITAEAGKNENICCKIV